MDSISTAKRCWWQYVIVGLEAHLGLATLAFVVWDGSHSDAGPVMFGIVWACVIPFFILFVGGVTLLFRRQPAWGWTALAFASHAFILLGLVLPGLASARCY